MVNIIWKFNDFLNSRFDTISMGFTPSGNIHIGFLVTLACSLYYLKENPKTNLIITNIENSLDTRINKYGAVPLRFQEIHEGILNIPTSFKNLNSRNLITKKIQSEVNDLIWKLTKIFDKNTDKNKLAISNFQLNKSEKKILISKENKIHNFLSSKIKVYSFLSIFNKDKKFRKKFIENFMDLEFAKSISILTGLNDTQIRNFGNKINKNNKLYSPKYYNVPIRLYCPDCKKLTPKWAKLIFSHPNLSGPTFGAMCENISGKCPRALNEIEFDKYVFNSINNDLSNLEFHFMLDPIRDFYKPFKSDCHIFGGDYFQLKYTNSNDTGIDRLKKIFELIEKKTGEHKSFFGGPLILMDGMKMSKSGDALNIKDLSNISSIFKNIIKILEEIRSDNINKEFKIDYKDIINKITKLN